MMLARRKLVGSEFEEILAKELLGRGGHTA